VFFSGVIVGLAASTNTMTAHGESSGRLYLMNCLQYFTVHSATSHTIHTANKSSAVAEVGDRGHNRHGPKRWGGSVPVLRRGGTPSNTMWPGPRSTSVTSGAFIHPAIWPQ